MDIEKGLKLLAPKIIGVSIDASINACVDAGPALKDTSQTSS